MIRQQIDRLSERYNACTKETRILLLLTFCLGFLFLLWLSVSQIGFNVKVYTNRTPAHIGRPSGPQFEDSITHQKQ